MIKKEYIKPATQIIEAEMEQEILVANYDDSGFGDLWDAN